MFNNSQASDATANGGVTVVISWVRHHGRSAGLASALQAEALFPPDRLMDARIPWRYFRLVVWTRRELRARTPLSMVIAMMPPSFLVLVVRASVPQSTKVVGDLHSAVLRGRRWAWARPIAMMSMRRDGALVTNGEDAKLLRGRAVEATVLHDDIQPSLAATPRASKSRRPAVVFPASYASDEPLQAILDACRLLPDVDFYLTGRTPPGLFELLPPNAKPTGFLSHADFAALVADADVVLALTTRNFTMQRAGYESFAVGIPQVTSDFPLLHEFYESSAVYCDPHSPRSIADAVSEALGNAEALRARIVEVRAKRINEQQRVYRALRANS